MKTPLFIIILCFALFSCKKQELQSATSPKLSKLKTLATGDHALVLVKTSNLMKIYMITGQDSDRWVQLNIRHEKKDTLPADFVHIPNKRDPSSNYDIWHFKQANEAYRSSPTSFVFTEDAKRLCESAEWEFGMWQTGASDHSGGAVHGSEKRYHVEFKADGKFFNEDKAYQVECDVINLAQYSYVYQWNKYRDTNILARLIKNYTIKRDSIIIKYTITFLKPTQLNSLKFGMLPAIRNDSLLGNITHSGTRTVNGVVSPVVNISTTNFTPSGILTNGNPNTTKIDIWGNDFAVSVETVRSQILPNSRMLVSRSDAYNKIYPDFTGTTSVADNQVYTMTAKYYLGLKN